MKVASCMVLIAALSASGCAHQSKEMTGQQIGIVIGAILGAAVGKNDSADFAGAVIGGAIGGVIGASIGRDLDEADRAKAQAAARAAVREPGLTQVTWKSDNNPGVGGTVVAQPVQTTYVPPPASQPRTATSPVARATPCRTVTHLINVNGREQKEEGRMCQQPDGSWSLS